MDKAAQECQFLLFLVGKQVLGPWHSKGWVWGPLSVPVL